MNNKEVLNICYKLLNRFITVNALIDMLESIDKDKFSKEEITKLNELINDIKTISENNPNKEDEYVIKQKESLKKLIGRLEAIPEKDDALKRHLEHLKKDYEKEIDSFDRWVKASEFIINNKIFIDSFDCLSDYEFLEFIAQYIKAPLPPSISQEKFEKVVKAGIEKDEREWLWRLAYNYENKDIKLDSIVNYFIKVKDGYYLVELISAVGDCLDIDAILDKVTDKDLIEYLVKEKKIISSYVSEKQINKLASKLN